MMSLFKFLQTIIGRSKPDQRSTNQLIADIVKHRNRPADVREFYRRLPTMPLFAKVADANFVLEHGREHVVKDSDILKIGTGLIPSGHKMVRFYIDATDPRLLPAYISMAPRDALKMVFQANDCDGLVICTPTDSWVALPKQDVGRILQQILARPTAQ